MINLIPQSARRLVLKEYWLRVTAVWLFLLGTGCLLVASLMLPTYMLLRSELVTLREQVASNAASTATFDQSSAALTTAMKQAALLRSLATSSTVSDTEYIMDIAGSEVTLNRISFEQGTDKILVTLSGLATTRAALANFRDRLEGENRYADATLPISSLIKDKNLEFTMTLTIVTS